MRFEFSSISRTVTGLLLSHHHSKRDPAPAVALNEFALQIHTRRGLAAASRRLSPSTYTARRTCPYSSTPFIPPPSAHLGRRFTAAGLSLRRVLYPAASVMDFLSGALTLGSWMQQHLVENPTR